MYPHERSLVKQLAGKPFAIIGVNSDPDREQLKERIKEENITWRSFWSGEEGTGGPIPTAWNIQGWPTLYILDEKGIIRFKGHGGDLDGVITRLLAEMGHEVKIVHEEEDAGEPGDKNEKKDGDGQTGNR